MLLKRLSALMAAVFFLLTAFASLAYADNFPGTSIPTGTNGSAIVSDAETNYGIWNENLPGSDAQQSYDLGYVAPPHELQVTVKYNGQSIPTNYGELTYGSPHGDFSNGHYRYIGYTYEGDNYTNIAYPPDAVPNGADFETQQWIPTPWKFGTLGAIHVAWTPWDGQQSFTDPGTGQSIPTNILLQVGTWYLNQTTGVGGVDGEPGTGYAFDLGDGNQLWQKLYQYADIMMPPTETTWGMARMFHMYNNYPYYVDVPIPPLALAEMPFLVVSPTTATVNVGATQQFDAWYSYNGQETKVTSASAWSDDNNSVASIGTNTGLATGDSAGSTNITATYTPLGWSALTGTAALTVQGQQQQQNGGYNATLSFQAVNQPEIKTIMGQEIGGTLHRKVNTAMWTDTVTATLSVPQPDVSSYVPAGGVVQSVTWSISNATLTYPAQNPDYTFGNPVEPTTTTGTSMTPSGHEATASFEENWSEDGLNGGAGIHDTLTNSTIAATPVTYPISATCTVNGTVSGYVPTRESDGNGGTTIVDVPFTNQFTLHGSAAQDLLVDGTGAVPMTSAGQNYMVGDISNPGGVGGDTSQ